jgi:hypothetical protein
MPKIWKEQFDPARHQNRMDSTGVTLHPIANFVPTWVYFVRVCSFTFEFHSIAQINDCLEYYSHKLRPSSRLEIGSSDHWEVQRWFERLPMYLAEEPKRKRVVRALTSALEQFGADSPVT